LKQIQRNNFWERGSKPLNIDLSHRCPLVCPQYARQGYYKNHGEKVPEKDLSIDDFKKIAQTFSIIDTETNEIKQRQKR